MGNAPYWSVFRAAPNREHLAIAGVMAQGFEVFRPLLRTKIGSRWTRIGLFPGYSFVRILGAWRAIDRTPGVLGLIKNGDTPAKCPDAEVGRLLVRCDGDNVIRFLRPPIVTKSAFQPGDRITVRGFDAVYLGMSAQDRELVLMTVLGSQRQVEVAAGLLAPH
jgi:transcription antitermination factor NusG